MFASWIFFFIDYNIKWHISISTNNIIYILWCLKNFVVLELLHTGIHRTEGPIQCKGWGWDKG